MAPRKTAAAKSTAAPVPAPSFTVEESAVDLTVNREEKPNPLEGAARDSLARKATLQVGHGGVKETAVEIENCLRRAAKKLACGMSMRRTDTHVVFLAKQAKRSRKYTAADIRAWGEANSVDQSHMFPKISAELRAAYRKANGFEKSEDENENAAE